MKHLIKNDRGLTLVEGVAVLVIAFIIAALIFGIVKSSLEQQAQQTKETDDLFDITYALKVVTKDIRRSIEAEAPTSELTLTFSDTSKATYSLVGGHLKKETTRTVGGIESTTTETITDGVGCAQFTAVDVDVISIELSNTSVCPEGKKTEIHLRKGSS